MRAAITVARKDPRPHKVGAVLIRGGFPGHLNLHTLIEEMFSSSQRVRKESDYLLAFNHGGYPWPVDHAESGLLDHLLRDEDLSGATLYVTLEPCVSTHYWRRKHGEMSCSETIVKAGIARVFVGMKDPNSVIYTRGITRLDMNGIPVEFFPDDLRREYEELVKDWIRAEGKKWQYNQIFAALEGHRGGRVKSRRGLAVNDALCILLCPNIRQGWKASEVRMHHRPSALTVRSEDRDLYDSYRRVFYERKRFYHDNPKIMLTRVPWDTTDAGSLSLETQTTTYSYIQFYKDVVTASDERRARLVDEVQQLDEISKDERENLIGGITDARKSHAQRVEKLLDQMTGFSNSPIDLPHALCLHLVLVTSDKKLLVTCRNPQSEYRPSTWSCSIEEHMASSDVAKETTSEVLRWSQRAMREELGLQAGTFDAKNVRILSVFLESDILNISLCAWVQLRIDSHTLAAILRMIPHSDDELTAWSFVDCSESELIPEILWGRGVTSYHPTSQFRMLMALMKVKGLPKNAHQYLSEWSHGK